MKKIKIFIFVLLLLFIVFYFSFLYILPHIFNKSSVVHKIENIIYSKTDIMVKSEGIRIQTYPNFNVKVILKKLNLKDKSDNEIFNAIGANFSLNIFKLKPDNFFADYIFINETNLKNILNKGKGKKTSDFNIEALPQIIVHRIDINLGTEKEPVYIQINDLAALKNVQGTIITTKVSVDSPLLKNKINIGDNGYIVYKDSALYAEKLSVLFGKSELLLNGKIIDDNKKSDLSITGSKLPIFDVESSILYFLKFRKNGKVFIENFKKFDGTLDVNLKLIDGGLYGSCNAENLSFSTVIFDIPAYFKKVAFKFDNRNISANAFGILGNEKINTSFKLTDFATINQEFKGQVNSVLSDEFVHKYIPHTRLKGSVKTLINYDVKKSLIKVDYLVHINPNSNIYYKNANLGMEDFGRRLYVKTEKTQDKLTVTSYDYSFIDENGIKNILTGEALFKKENGKLRPNYITCKTNGYAPVSVTGSFGKYVDGGYFDGSVKYDKIKNKVTGDFTLINSKYKNFFLETAKVVADDKNMSVIANGTYNNSDFNWDVKAENDFNKKIHVYYMDLFLDKFVVKKGASSINTSDIEIPTEVDNIKVDIDKWTIKLNQISHKRIIVKNIILSGNLKNDVFKFNMPAIKFAGGVVSASGMYNFRNNSSVIDFSADNINSNTVADVVFNLPNQIHGYAGAKLHVKTRDNLQDIQGHADFSVKDGYLVKLGSTEFIIKKSKKIKRPIKIKISDIINVDITKTKALRSDITGSFDIDNYEMNNIKLTSRQKYLSMLIEGRYDIKKQDADIKLWGKYNKSAGKGVRIMFVPLSWIVKIVFKPEKTKDLYQDKINKIPPIVAKPDEQQAFRVNMKGNINNNNVKVELKSII